MIRIFKSKKLLFTPTEFLNSVARWLLGIHSPTGTIRIRNTANPAEDGGAAVDIDPSETFKAIEPHLRSKYVKVRDTKLLGASLKWDGGQLEVDDNWLKARVIDNDSTDPSSSDDQPQDVADTANKGTLDKCARADHVHALQTGISLAFDASGNLGAVFGTSSGTVAEGDHNHDADYADIDHDHDSDYADINHNHDSDYASKGTETTVSGHESRIAALESASPSGSGVSSVNGKTGAVTLDADDVGALDSNDINVTVQAHSSKLDALDDLLNSDGTLSSSAVSDPRCTSGGDCLAYFTADGELSHLSYLAHTATVSQTDAATASFSYTTSGGTKTAVLNYKAAGASSAPTTQKVIGFAENSETAALVSATVFDTSYTMTGDNIVATKSNGKLTGLSLGYGLKIDSSELAPKFKSNGGITADSNGLQLDSVGSANKTLQLITVTDASSTDIQLNFYGLEIDANGRIVGRASSPYKQVHVGPAF